MPEAPARRTAIPSEKPSTIKISEAQRHEIAADRADLHVTVEGTSLFTGGEALTKAREVAQLVRELTGFGLLPEDIYLQGVHADKYTGTLSPISHARYSLRVHCAELQTLADLLGIITSQKNATLSFIGWGYPDDGPLQDQWLEECITRANAKAALVASSLNVRLLGVHAFSENYTDGEKPRRTAVAEDAAFLRSRTARVSPEELGLDISHTKAMHVSVEVEYLVSGYEPAPHS